MITSPREKQIAETLELKIAHITDCQKWNQEDLLCWAS